jgi:GDPmannose 4,6-dehydratase
MDWKEKRVFITGISGFVGSHLAESLMREGAQVFGFAERRATGIYPSNIRHLLPDANLTLIEGDIVDIAGVAHALRESEPEVVFHLAAQSYIPRSFTHPSETHESNSTGVLNLVESIRQLDLDPVTVFAGSSEEYGLVISSDAQHNRLLEKYGTVYPEPKQIPELPISEKNPLRPLSPYALTKVYGEYLFRLYFQAYGLKNVMSRGFNHEGPRRGKNFVTSVITSKVMELKTSGANRIQIGNVNAFRDWSHVDDIIEGYCLLARRGAPGEVYNQGSERTHSVLTFLLLALKNAGYGIEKISTLSNSVSVEDPTQEIKGKFYGKEFLTTKIDRMMLEEEVSIKVQDEGIAVKTDKGAVAIKLDPKRFRPLDVPILMCNAEKAKSLGFKTDHSLEDVIISQLDFYMSDRNRRERGEQT